MITLPNAQFVEELGCPNCGDPYLHHGVIEIFDRAEDSKITTHVVVAHEMMVKTGPRPSVELNNPSLRRHGLRINHWCEGCSHSMDLCLAQHKGNTYLYWDMDTLEKLELTDDA